MTFCGEHEWRIPRVERMRWIKKQKKILGGFAQEEAFHTVAQLSSTYVLESSPSTFGPASSLDVAKRHFANVEIPRVLGSSIKIPAGFNEFWAAAPPTKAVFYVSRPC